MRDEDDSLIKRLEKLEKTVAHLSKALSLQISKSNQKYNGKFKKTAHISAKRDAIVEAIVATPNFNPKLYAMKNNVSLSYVHIIRAGLRKMGLIPYENNYGSSDSYKSQDGTDY